VLHSSNFHKNVQYHGLYEINTSLQHEFPPYILGDKDYSVMSWIMTTFKEEANIHFGIIVQYATLKGLFCSGECF
jgi:hypothetical protein